MEERRMVRIEVHGLKNVYNFTVKLPEEIEKVTRSSNERFMKDLRRTSKFKCPRSSGEAARGIDIDRTKTRGKQKQYKLVAKEPYTYWIIHGRRPGRRPPLQELMKWNKLNPSKAGQTNKFAAALKLANWIAKHGTRPNDFVGRALEHTMSRWDMIIQEELRRIR